MMVFKRNLLFQSPFSGDMLICLIGNRPIEDSIRRFTTKTHEMGPRVEVSEYRPVGLQRGDYTMELVPDG